MSDNTNDSDDLIAELARLMADDAQASRPDLPANDLEKDISLEQPLGDEKPIESISVVEEAPEPLKATESIFSSKPLDVPDTPDVPDMGEPVIEEKIIQESILQEPLEEEPLVEAPIALEPLANEQNAEASSDNSDSDPIADLISEKLGEATKADLPDVDNPDDDNFKLPPVFGLGSNETNAQAISEVQLPDPQDLNINEQVEQIVASTKVEIPSIEPVTQENIEQSADDPIMDIENLIGEAVRAGDPNLTSVGEVKSDISNIAQDSQADIDAAANAAEKSILAASRDSGVNNLEELATDNAAIVAEQVQSKQSFIGGILGPAIAGALLLGVGFGLFWFFDQRNNPAGEVPVLNADSSPQKTAPEQNANSQTDQSVVYNEISGDNQPSSTEQLVSRDESISDDGVQVDRIIPTDSSTQTGFANRKVRTVTVRPDGTIVSGDSTRAGSEELPVDRPNVPDLPEGSTVEIPQTQVADTQTPLATTEQNITENAPITNTPNIIAPIPHIRPKGLALATPAIIPASAPVATNIVLNNQAVNLIANNANQSVTPPQASAPTAAPPSSSVVTASPAPAYIQLSSQRSEQTARASMAEIKARFTQALGSSKLEIQRANLGDRGIYYRVRVPANSLAEANNICTNIKTAGGECFVRTN